jgi:GAF domain-containing protein
MRALKRYQLPLIAAEPTVLESFARQVFTLTQAQGAAIAVREPQGWFWRASVGDAPAAGSIAGDSPLTRQCRESGLIAICQDAKRDERFQPSTSAELRFRCAAAIPIKAGDVVLGVMELFSQRPSAFTVGHIAEAQRHAVLLGLLLEEEPGAPGDEEQCKPLERGLVLMFPSTGAVPLRPSWIPDARRQTARPG